MSLWEFTTSTAGQTQKLAENLAGLLRAGDLIILSGELGAGKTTFTQGLGRSLGVREGIISPTFVLVRIHLNLPEGPNPGGPDLVHVDAYRLATPGEIDDIDLENTMDSAVTVVEWGIDRVEHLAASRLEIELVRAAGGDWPVQHGAPVAESQDFAGSEDSAGSFESFDTFDADEDDNEPRTLRLQAFGPRWDGIDFSGLGEKAAGTPKNLTE